jgi:hypothetical protein
MGSGNRLASLLQTQYGGGIFGFSRKMLLLCTMGGVERVKEKSSKACKRQKKEKKIKEKKSNENQGNFE